MVFNLLLTLAHGLAESKTVAAGAKHLCPMLFYEKHQ